MHTARGHASVCKCTCWNMRAARLPFVWRIRPLLLFLCPRAALRCQVEPEGLALIMAKGLTVTLTQDVVMASPGQGWTGHASPSPLPHPETMRAIADHLLPLPSQQSWAQGQITLSVCLCVCVRCFFQPSPHLLYCHFTVSPAGPPRCHIYLLGKWGTAAAGHVKTFTNSIKNVTVAKKSWGRK